MKQPQLTTPSDISLHEPLRCTLPNGVTIHTLCAAEFEVVRVSFVFRAGSAQQRKAFFATSTANLLSEGTRDMTSQQIAEQFDFYGSYFDVNVDRDYVYISFCSLSKYFRQTLAVAEQILLHPLFPEEEVASYREKRKQRLRIERMKVETEAREAFARALFGPAHPYGITWPETAYDDLTRDDLLDFYARHYTARNCFVVCSGAADAAVVDAVAEVAGQLPAGADSAAETFPPAARYMRRGPTAPKNRPRRQSRRPMPQCPTQGPCSRRSASAGCSSAATTPITSGCRWWRCCWAVISGRA